MKRALIVSNTSGLVTLFLKNDVELLLKKNYVIDVACNTEFPDSNTEEFFDKYCDKVFHVPFPIRNLDLNLIWKSYKDLINILKHTQYDLLHCHSTIAAVLARQSGIKYRKNGMRVMYTSHGFPFYSGNHGRKAKFFKKIENYYSRYTDGIITICKEDYENAIKMKCKNVTMMHGVGVNVERFMNISIDRSAYRENLGFASTDKVILSIGELNTNKNHQIVIRAISELNDPDIVYAICGREVTELGKKNELKLLADELNVRLAFLGFRKDIAQICHSVEIGALPSFKEGLGLSGIEMLASGIPVVGSNRQGIKDYIVDGVTGYLADPEDSSLFAVSIQKCFALLNDNNIKNNCIRKSQHFNIEQARETIQKIYQVIGV